MGVGEDEYADQSIACASIIVGVTVTMIAIGIQKPDMNHMVIVRPGVPLVKGLAPVMNIVLAYSKCMTLASGRKPTLTLCSWARCVFLLCV